MPETTNPTNQQGDSSRLDQTTDRLASNARDTAGRVASTATQSADRIAATAHQAADRLASGVHQTAERVVAGANTAVERLQTTARAASERFGQVSGQVNDVLARREEMLDSARQAVRERPLAALGMAAAIGFLLARITR